MFRLPFHYVNPYDCYAGNIPMHGVYPFYHQGDWNMPYDDMPFMEDRGQPFVMNIHRSAIRNQTFRTVVWTGKHLQLTLMSIGVGEDIGLEVHPHVDQFLRIEQGEGVVQIGDTRTQLNFVRRVSYGDVILVPAGKWHNLTNVGPIPLKLYSIYAPPEHPSGTVHVTKADALTAEHS